MLEIKKFAADMDAFELDTQCLRKCFQTGLFEESVEIDGASSIHILRKACCITPAVSWWLLLMM